MGRAPSTLVVVALLALVAAIGLRGWLFGRSEPAIQSEPATTVQPATADTSDPAAEGGAPGVKTPTLYDLPRPTLTAHWMTAPANPLIVEITTGNRDEQQKITPGGGELELTLDTGDHVTLRVPAGAVTRNAEFRLESVTTIRGWPHAPGAVVSVLVSAEPGVLLRGASLTFERRSRRDRASLPAMAGFVVDRGNRELHLYPSKRESGDENVERFTMPVTRFGAYGIVEAPGPDVEVMHARIPTDLPLTPRGQPRSRFAAANANCRIRLAPRRRRACVIAIGRDYYQQVLLFGPGRSSRRAAR